MIEVQLPDGRVLEVDAPDPQSAAQAARQFLTREKAQGRIASEDAQRGPVSNFMKNFADGTTQIAAGIPFAGGLVDEGNAMVRSGGGLWGNYDDELAYERERQTQAAQRSPTATTANTLAGGIGGGAAMFPAKLLQGGSTAVNVAKGAGIGGGAGAVEGFTRGEGGTQNRLDAMPMAAGIGAGMGGAAPVIGKIVGGLVNAFTQQSKRMPSVAEIKELARQGYERATNAGLKFHPDAWAKVVDDIAGEAENYGIGGQGWLGKIAGRENPTMSRMVDTMGKSKGEAAPFMDVERAKRVAYNSKDPAARMAGGKLKRAIDESTPGDYIAGNVDEGLSGIKQGREMWSRAERAKVVDEAVRNAQIDAKGKLTQAGYDHSLQQQFRAIAKSDDFQYWPKAEQDAVMKVVNGTFGQKTLKLIGAASPKGGLSSTLNMGLTALAPQIGIPFAIGTTGARVAASKMGINNARLAHALIKSGEALKPTKQSRIARQMAEQLMLGQSGQMGERIAGAVRGDR